MEFERFSFKFFLIIKELDH